MDEVDYIDMADGADEIAPDFRNRRGGGALLFEQSLPNNQRSYLDCRQIKNGRLLRSFPLPVEVVPMVQNNYSNVFEALGYKPTFRERDGERYLTDNKRADQADVYPIKDPIAFGEKSKAWQAW